MKQEQKQGQEIALLIIQDKETDEEIESEEKVREYRETHCLSKQPLSGQTMKLLYAKESGPLNHAAVDRKLAEWREGYLKRRAELRKYEPMLYFLDLYN